MKLSAYPLMMFLTVAMASCSDTNELIESEPTPNLYDDPHLTGPWTLTEDDNRTRLEPCGLGAWGKSNTTSITARWREPANRYVPPPIILPEISEVDDNASLVSGIEDNASQPEVGFDHNVSLVSGIEDNASQPEIGFDHNASLVSGADDKLVKLLYRLEVAEDESFTIGYLSFSKLKETVFVVENLKPKTVYFVRLQAYYESIEHSLAPSVPEIISTITGDILSPPANFELTVGYGKFSIRWEPPSHAEGKFEYLVRLYNEESTEKPFEHRSTKVPFIKDWVVIPEKNYMVELLTWSDPETTNEVLNYPPIQEYFRVPGNELDVPQNLKISGEGDFINLTWDPIDNNLHDFEYLLKIHLDGNKSDEFGTHYLNDPMFSMSGVQQNLRYWFDVQAVPSRNNKVDVDSETISSFMELTSMTYATPTIRSVKIEPLADDEIPEAVIILAWEESANGDGHQTYWIEIAYDAEFRTGFQDHEAEPGSLEAELGPFDLGKTYYFRMYARGPDEDATRISSERSEVRKIVMPPAIP